MEQTYLAFFLFFIIAALYSSVGHAGASGYLAVMALLSFTPESIKPTSLVLNILVAAIASYKFIRAGYFDKRIFLTFIVTSIPLAFVGGYITISPRYFKLIAGVFLVLSALMLLLKQYIRSSAGEEKPMRLSHGLVLGGVIGLVSGLVGVGGGIFLSPIILLCNWTSTKNASGIAALFILCNSISGLLGHVTALSHLDTNMIYWIVAVLLGGLLGSHFGARRFSNRLIIFFLFLVLLSAGLKFILVDFLK